MIDAYRFYITARVFYAICWTTIVTLNLVYMVEVAGLDPLQMVLVGTVLELSVFLFEIPTGVVADVVSRKLSVVVGHAMMGVGFLVLALWPTFTVILLSQVIWGVGYTFISGAYPAWLSAEVGVERANQGFLRGSQLAHGGAFVGIAIAVGLGHASLQLPIAVGSVGLMVLAGGMGLFMQETTFQPTATRDTWSAMRRTFTDGVHEIRRRTLLVLMLVITAMFGAFSEGIDRLFTPFLIERFEFPALGGLQSVTWWGLIAAAAHVVGFVSTTVARRYVRLDNQRVLTWVLASLMFGIGVSAVAVANVDGFLGVLACFWLLGGLRSAYGPLQTAWLNRLIPEQSKATLFSMFGQSDAIGQVAGGPIIGAIAKTVSIAFALGASALLLLPSVDLYRRALKAVKGEASDDLPEVDRSR